MSAFRVNITAADPSHPDKTTTHMETLVDTGSELSWLPEEALASVGIKPVRKRTFRTATKQLIEKRVGYAILSAEGFETVDENEHRSQKNDRFINRIRHYRSNRNYEQTRS